MFHTSPLGESRRTQILPGSYVRGTHRNAVGGAELRAERR
jgi:hypothetical protein